MIFFLHNSNRNYTIDPLFLISRGQQGPWWLATNVLRLSLSSVIVIIPLMSWPFHIVDPLPYRSSRLSFTFHHLIGSTNSRHKAYTAVIRLRQRRLRLFSYIGKIFILVTILCAYLLTYLFNGRRVSIVHCRWQHFCLNLSWHVRFGLL